jgi:tRNA/tmRNA/rRNA uracil-C5-methylase (TrmA/RlmC/RlmD family)
MSTFSEVLHNETAHLPLRHLATNECRTPQGKRCELCSASRIDYDVECTVKSNALRLYWEAMQLPGVLGPLVRSPKGRQYRTVSKRKIFVSKGKFTLGLLGIDESRSNSFGIEIGDCVIEPTTHAAVYTAVSAYLAKSEHRDIAELLTYVIVKGSQEEFTVILNTASYSPHERQMFTSFSKYLTKHVPAIVGVFVFVDAERSKYYLSGNAAAQKKRQLVLHKLFGNAALFHAVGPKKFLYSPLSFSQTNHSILEEFTSMAGAMLRLDKKDHLYDLYCGYGLFSLCLAEKVQSVTGVEMSRDSIADAAANAKRLHAAQSRFVASDIADEALPRFMKHHGKGVKILLDPPRNGTKPGVIETIAEFRPERVVHIFCNIEIIGAELKRWEESGYTAAEAVPFDMFPGTDDVEIMVGLVPKL